MNELATIRSASNVDAYRASTDAAELCKAIVVATSSSIQGRRYVSVEGWQAIARAHGCAAGVSLVEKIEGGIRAVGEVRDIMTGNLVASAEGFVGEDEPTWYGGQSRGKTLPKRADYAIRAMAQTRAMSRACRSAFSHVIVMMNAGLQTTPAEEVPSGGFDDTPHNPQTGEIEDAPREKVIGISRIKERLRALKAEGNKIGADEVGSLERLNELIHAAADDLTAIKEGNHDWWTGDADYVEGTSGNEGLKRWIKRRRAEMETPPESVQFQLLMSTLAEVETKRTLAEWLARNMTVIDELDGAESRAFEDAYGDRETAIHAMDSVSV